MQIKGPDVMAMFCRTVIENKSSNVGTTIPEMQNEMGMKENQMKRGQEVYV